MINKSPAISIGSTLGYGINMGVDYIIEKKIGINLNIGYLTGKFTEMNINGKETAIEGDGESLHHFNFNIGLVFNFS